MLTLPPLTLYIHLPWCVRRCPYCDFNAHRVPAEMPEAAYVDALLADLEVDLPYIWGRTVHAVFLGGGTPSLFSAAAIDRLLSGVRARVTLAPDAEVTMEANPGTVEHDRFAAYRAAGVNRVSLGIQSFSDGSLKRLGRIHGRGEAEAAIEQVKHAGFDNFNLDLMFALPEQSLAEAVADVHRALLFEPPHISHYQLTLEPGTGFAANPPPLPDEDLAWDMQQACGELLVTAGFGNYEISAWARPGRACRHNLNYWRYGDYLGIGAGAHGKLTLPAAGAVQRTERLRHPRHYLGARASGGFVARREAVAEADRVFEFFLNRFRLDEPIRPAEFEALTGVAIASVAPALDAAAERGLIVIDGAEMDGATIRRTQQGGRFLNDLQALFLPDPAATSDRS